MNYQKSLQYKCATQMYNYGFRYLKRNPKNLNITHQGYGSEIHTANKVRLNNRNQISENNYVQRRLLKLNGEKKQIAVFNRCHRTWISMEKR